MTNYGSFDRTVEIDGLRFNCELVEQAHAARAGFEQILAVKGLPQRFEQALVRAAQVSNAPHTWRVQECQREEEVTSEILDRGLAALRNDIVALNANIISYCGIEKSKGEDPIFLAAGAIRNKLTRDFESNEFPVVSRAVVVPRYRGLGLGSLIVEHRMKAALRFFGQTPKAIHFGTESQKILHSVRKVESEAGVKFVYIGDERYSSTDGIHTVHDYLCFLPWYRNVLLDACAKLEGYDALAGFAKDLASFMTHGVNKVSGESLEKSFGEMCKRATAVGAKVSSDALSAIKLLEEFFTIKNRIGARDPS